jgi:RHS repeat-associated protein
VARCEARYRRGNGGTERSEPTHSPPPCPNRGKGVRPKRGAKGIVNIGYNYLNLPDEISFGGGKKLTFVYDAMGRKLSKRVYDGTSVEDRSYFGGIEYRNGQLERVATSAGSVTKQQTVSVAFRYEYVLGDHLGNTRAVISDLDDNGLLSVGSEVIQVNHYYPYGLNMQGPWNGSAGSYKYQYNGKELTDALNLNWNDYGARYYDASMDFFPSIDRFAEKFPYQSPYAFAGNNPVKFIDINGDSIDIYNPQGQYIRTDDDGKKGFSAMLYQSSSTDDCGNISYCDGLSFTYNDPSEDRISVLRDGYKVQLTSVKDIQNMVLDGVKGSEYPYRHAYNEGQAGGNLDFFVQNPDEIPANTLSIIKDRNGNAVSYNPKDYGNFMFGLSMRFLGISLSEAKLGAHLNNIVNGRRDGSEKWQLLDSGGDQRAITNGYYFTIRPQNETK